MASGTTDHNLGAAYELISGAELYIAGLVTVGVVELWYGPVGTQGTNKGLPLAAGDDFRFTMGVGDGLYARAQANPLASVTGGKPSGSLTVMRRGA